MRIALFVTCLADTLFPDVGKSTTVLLERLGHQVEFPHAQTCCGQMHVNTGYQREALPLIRRYVETFERYDVIVAPSGSCVGSIRHQHAMVARRLGDDKLAVGHDRRLAERMDRAQLFGRAHVRLALVAHDLVRRAEFLKEPQHALTARIVQVMDDDHGVGRMAKWRMAR